MPSLDIKMVYTEGALSKLTGINLIPHGTIATQDAFNEMSF